ncbi:MAG: 2-phosphosulfolactate phosphatase [Chloroflexi bacterium]|nr:2-phosphosulfolactate phosphatase [Chloroflexota bacterium]MYF22199.1 2-phosphosulfolactate phosphatase [Chloroflexota bacterium]
MSHDESLEVEVYLQPPPADALADASAIVLDIFRATTVHAALFAGGAEAIYPVADFAAGVALREMLPGSVLIGEVGALPPAEAAFGNSPTEFTAMDVSGWTVVHVTSNGTRALSEARQADIALSDCLRNVSATLSAVLERRPERIAIVCSGDRGGTAPSVEDSFAAGAYVAALKRMRPDIRLRGGARLALKLYDAYGRAPARAFADSPHGDHLRKLGFDADFGFAGALDASSDVIELAADAAGRPVLRVR